MSMSQGFFKHKNLSGSVVDDTEAVCQQALVQILCDTWGGCPENATRGVAHLRGELTVVRPNKK